jgi:hypothetical protein
LVCWYSVFKITLWVIVMSINCTGYLEVGLDCVIVMSINCTGYLEVGLDCVKRTSCCLYAEKALCLSFAVLPVPLLFRCNDALYFTILCTCFFYMLLFGRFFGCLMIVYHLNIIQRQMRRDSGCSQLKNCMEKKFWLLSCLFPSIRQKGIIWRRRTFRSCWCPGQNSNWVRPAQFRLLFHHVTP